MDKTAYFVEFLFGLLEKEAEPFQLEGSAPPEPTDRQKTAGNYKKDRIMDTSSGLSERIRTQSTASLIRIARVRLWFIL